MNDETRKVLTALSLEFHHRSSTCTWSGDYGSGLINAYEACADEIDELLATDPT